MDNPAKKRILIVDDTKSNLMVLYGILNKEYSLLMARSGLEAIERANLYTPDLILLDILMPEMDGYTVIAALKSFEKTKNIPVVFITGLCDPEEKKKGLSLGAVDYIYKPFSPEDVKRRVQGYLGYAP